MNLLAILIIGALVGWLAAQVAGRKEGLLGSIVIGVVGSFIGSFVSAFLTGSDQSYLAFSWVGLFWSFIGALILVVCLNALQRRSSLSHRA
jgi:uncharacterized membrane protein YeaQ/YmgE (transglycosylase-associated protein family)